MQGRTVLALGQNSELLTELKCVNPPAAWLRGSPHISCHGPTQGPVYPKSYIYIGYLSNFVHKYVYSYLSRRKERDDQRPRTTLTLLYSNTLSEAVDHPKDLVPAVPAEEQKGVIYCVPCDGCPEKYIGQTGCCLKHRLAEHRHALKKGDVATSALAEHTLGTGHPVDLSKAE